MLDMHTGDVAGSSSVQSLESAPLILCVPQDATVHEGRDKGHTSLPVGTLIRNPSWDGNTVHGWANFGRAPSEWWFEVSFTVRYPDCDVCSVEAWREGQEMDRFHGCPVLPILQAGSVLGGGL